MKARYIVMRAVNETESNTYILQFNHPKEAKANHKKKRKKTAKDEISVNSFMSNM